jgi:hypothetical protein
VCFGQESMTAEQVRDDIPLQVSPQTSMRLETRDGVVRVKACLMRESRKPELHS